MDRDELIRQLIGTFREELDEHVDTLERDLTALEKAGGVAERRPLVDTVFRTVHSLKGAARAVDIVPIETACHRLEEILSALRADTTCVNAAVIRLLFEFTDALADASRRLHADETLDDSLVHQMLPRIEGFSLDKKAPGALGAGTAVGLIDDTEITLTGSHEIRSEMLLEPEATAAEGGDTLELGAEGQPASSEHERQRAHHGRRGAHGNTKSLRVSAAKLDELLTGSGELMLAVRRAESMVDELESMGDHVRAWYRSVASEEQQARRLQSQPHASMPDAPADGVAAPGAASIAAQLQKLSARIEQLAVTAKQDLRSVGQVASRLDEQVHGLRMVPFGLICRGLERMVRELAVDCGKHAQLHADGTEVEIDRSVLEVLKAPLLHLIRNAVEHGIEPSEARERAGKPGTARVSVAAALRGVQVEVTVADDGAGIGFDAVRAHIAKRGLPVPASDSELIPYLFMAGFSTAPTVTRVAGRGMGLDVVKHEVESMHGTIALATEPGKGARFTITVPLTLSTIRALLVRLGDQVMAVPITTVVAAVRLDAGDITTASGWQTFLFQGAVVPLVRLADLLGMDADIGTLAGKVPAVVVAVEDRLSAFVVDELRAEQDIVVKNLSPRIQRLRHVSGGTILEDGRVALVLNVAELVTTARRQDARRALAPPAERRKLRILVADDSLTTRILEQTLLESAGYQVSLAVDGLDAWRILHEQGADLLVSDVEMPHMDGFALTQAVRSSPRFQRLPVILLTSLDSKVVRQRGLDAGANIYMCKSVFDQTELLDAIRQLV